MSGSPDGIRRQPAQRLSGRLAAIPALLGFAATMAACGDPVEVLPPLFDNVGIVEGTVADAASSPVEGAAVSIVARTADCASRVLAGEGAMSTGGPTELTATTEVQGTYAIEVWVGHPDLPEEFESCIEVRVDPPDGSGLQAESLSGFTLVLRKQNLAPPDTLQVDVTLSPAP